MKNASAERDFTHDERIKGIQGMEVEGDKTDVPKNTNVVESAGFDGRLFFNCVCLSCEKLKMEAKTC